MSEKRNKFYLTTPIYYVNARPHIGHAYSTIAADVIARRHRLLGDDTFFLTGTDEHGQKVQRSAAAAGIPPQQFTDEVSASFRNLWKRMGITNDDYIRTTEDRHKKGVQKLWKLLEERGYIYLSTYTGQYSVGEEMFVEGPPGTIGPDGKPTETVTEENYFFKLSEFQKPLLDFYEQNPDFISPAGVRNEVLAFVRGNLISAAGTVSVGDPGPLEQGLNFAEINEGISRGKLARTAAGTLYAPGALKDVSFSRTTFDWGIPVPGNEKHVIYVWVDALINYITAIGYGSDDPADQKKFERYWPADIHLVGKEITRFHCVYWPAILMAAGLPLPKRVVANGWLLFEESKMSKSRGNVVRTETILDAFGTLCPPKPLPLLSSRSEAEGSASLEPPQPPTKAEQDLFAADVLRYFLLREIPFGQDGSFSFDALVQRYNSDLANGYGNLVSRTLTLVTKGLAGSFRQTYSGGFGFKSNDETNEDDFDSPNDWKLGIIPYEDVEPLQPQSPTLEAVVSTAFEQENYSRALQVIWQAISNVDEHLSALAPWKLVGSLEPGSQNLLERTLYVAAESIRIITALLYPFMPYATAQVWSQLGLGDIEEAARKGELKNLEWGGLKPGTKLGPLAPIFPRGPKEIIQLMTEMEANNTSTTPKPAEPATEALAHQPAAAPTDNLQPATNNSPQIAIDDFAKIDLRVAKVLVAERIPKADKLLRLEVDLGYERRQILSGIAEWYTPEELIGRRIIIIANLAPRKMRGLESHGMLLAASHGENGKPILATFAGSDEIELGSRLK